MGCCNSRESGDGSPYPDSTTPTSSHAINTQPAPEPAATAARDRTGASPGQAQAAGAGRRRRRSQQPLDHHINKPLRRHEWASKNSRWSRAALDRERAAFFDTRVTGRPEIWLTLRAVLEVLWNEGEGEGGAGGEGDDGAGALEMAQTILDAAEVTLPTGNLTQGAYDNLGNYYAFHEWIVSDPTNVVWVDEDEDEEEDEGQGGDAEGGWRGRVDDEETKGMSPLDEVSGEEDDEALRRREEKGKAVVDVRDLITVYARLSEDARDIKLSVAKTESVRSVARKVSEESGLPATTRVRIAYMGKMLKENASLEDQGWRQGHVINAMVFTR